MNIILKKINTDHYVVVDDSEIKVGDWYYDINDKESLMPIYQRSQNPKFYSGCKKITHSTQPLDVRGYWGKVIPLTATVPEIKELIGEVDVEKKAEKFIGCKYDDIEDSIDQIGYDSFIRAYNQALEDNKEKKYTEEDVIRIVEKSRETGLTAEYLMMTSQPKTEWEVEFIDGKLTLKKQAQ